MTESIERYVVTRTIAASPKEIFAVLADPSRHRNTEPGDWVRDAAGTAPVTAIGQMFAMNMYLTQAGGDYVTYNLVNVFDEDRAIGWMPGALDDAGNHDPGGWSWRYDLAPNGDGTEVTLTYDWSATRQHFRDRVGGMPLFQEDYLCASLATLERSVAGQSADTPAEGSRVSASDFHGASRSPAQPSDVPALKSQRITGTDYNQDRIAEQYEQAIYAQAWRSRVEAHSFLSLIGDVKGKKVLDVACGEGRFTRILRKAGAQEVVGIDISDRMIESARQQEARQPLGIEYRVEDVRTLVAQPYFDLVVSGWLLAHARTRDELAQMCQGLASQVSPGGRFVMVTTNPGVYDFDSAPDYRKYGYEMALADHAFDGAPINFTVLLEDSTLKINDYYLPMTAYESAFTQAGFQNFAVHMPKASPGPDDEPGYWDDLLEYPFFILMDCVKPS
jgi:toxoflavin synthase